VGLSTDIGRWQLGLTVTTPSISLFGDGTSTFESTLATPDDATGNPQGVLAADRQQVASEFRSPLSVGFGVARTFGSTGLYLATEWFQQVDPYAILDTEPFEAQSSGASLSSDVTHQLKSATNVSIRFRSTRTSQRFAVSRHVHLRIQFLLSGDLGGRSAPGSAKCVSSFSRACRNFRVRKESTLHGV
jgi:hypothetical protein